MIYNTGNRLERAISRQVKKVEYFCSAENISPNPAVHELRKSFKRLRALLRFYNELSGNMASAAGSDIRNFGKRLAPLRESAVNIYLLEKEVKSNKLIPERKIRVAGEILVKKNRSLLTKELYENNLFSIINSYFNNFDPGSLAASGEQVTKNYFFNEVSRTYVKSYMIYSNLPAYPHANELHSLRKKLKRLFYQLDFIRFIHPRFFKLKTDQLNKINDQLGNDHDLYVFLQELSSETYDFNSGELYILENQVDHLREINQLKLKPRLNKLLTAEPEGFDQKLRQYLKL